MTIIQLEYIIAVDNHRHFGKAAAACFVTQPTLSMQIHKLEDQLGAILFDRSKQPIMPTDIGRRVIAQAREVVAAAKRVEELVAEEKDDIAGELTIGIIPTLSPYLVPLFIGSFTAKYPKVSVRINEMVTEKITDSLKKEILDIGIVATPLEENDIIEKALFYEEFRPYIAHRNNFSGKKYIAPQDIDRADVWLLNEGHCFRQQVLNLCHTHHAPARQLHYESGSLEALKNIVDKQGGMTLLPELATLNLSSSEKNNLYQFIDPKPVREVSIVMHHSYLKRKLVEALHSEILSSIPDYMNIEKHGQIIKWK